MYFKKLLYENFFWIIPYSVVGFGRKLNPTLVINFSNGQCANSENCKL